MINAETLVSDVLSQHPTVWDVFLRHGMCSSCQESPPPVSIQHFVEKHVGGDVNQFLSELTEAIN
jgi:hypothetical protein